MDEKFRLNVEKSMELEAEGYWFYKKCAETTKDKEGIETFNFLAGEEKIHYEKIADFLSEHTNVPNPSVNRKLITKVTGIFESGLEGKDLSKVADTIDALNLGIKSEEESINFYNELIEESVDEKTRFFFTKLAEEEKRHKSILERDIENLTKTGDFYDFKQVTS